MSSNKLNAVIMAGGTGERFWPRSRINFPKQLLKIFTSTPLIEETIDRISPFISLEDIYISTNQKLFPILNKTLPKIKKENYILEPAKKNTAAAIGLAAIYLSYKNPEGIMIILPSDHLISPQKKFLQVLNLAIELAEKFDSLVTIGIKPQKPATEYGYIQAGNEKLKRGNLSVFKLESFKEKPDKKTAEEFIKKGNYFWNCGIFIWKIKTILDAIKEYLPQLYKGLQKIKTKINTSEENRTKKIVFKELPDISIDYGIMEKVDNVLVIEGNFNWDDIGSWLALERFLKKDKNGNVSVGHVENIETKNTIICSDEKGFIATIGVSNLVIVSFKDAVLVCHKNKVEKIKEILKKIKTKEELIRYL